MGVLTRERLVMYAPTRVYLCGAGFLRMRVVCVCARASARVRACVRACAFGFIVRERVRGGVRGRGAREQERGQKREREGVGG